MSFYIALAKEVVVVYISFQENLDCESEHFG